MARKPRPKPTARASPAPAAKRAAPVVEPPRFAIKPPVEPFDYEARGKAANDVWRRLTEGLG